MIWGWSDEGYTYPANCIWLQYHFQSEIQCRSYWSVWFVGNTIYCGWIVGYCVRVRVNANNVISSNNVTFLSLSYPSSSSLATPKLKTSYVYQAPITPCTSNVSTSTIMYKNIIWNYARYEHNVKQFRSWHNLNFKFQIAHEIKNDISGVCHSRPSQRPISRNFAHYRALSGVIMTKKFVKRKTTTSNQYFEHPPTPNPKSFFFFGTVRVASPTRKVQARKKIIER